MIKLPNSRRGLQLIVILLTVIRNDEVGSFIAFLLDGFYVKVSISLLIDIYTQGRILTTDVFVRRPQ